MRKFKITTKLFLTAKATYDQDFKVSHSAMLYGKVTWLVKDENKIRLE